MHAERDCGDGHDGNRRGVSENDPQSDPTGGGAADPAVEEALYDSVTLRGFAGIDLGAEPVPDETTVCKFRHLLEEHHLGEEILAR
jgi:hypothetical protein